MTLCCRPTELLTTLLEGQLTLSVRLDGDHADEELRSLYAWFLADPDIRRYADLELRGAAPRPRTMGADTDLIYFAVGTGLSLAQMVASYVSWRRTRRREAHATFEQDGIRVTLRDVDEETVRRAMRAFEDAEDAEDAEDD